MTSLAHAYYRAVEGHWRCRFDLRIVDRAAMGALGLLERLGFALIARFCAWGIRPWLETSVTVGERDVVHTTSLRLGWLVLYRSVETLTSRDGDDTAAMHGIERTAPLYLAHAFEGTARIEPDASGAQYDISWMGTRLDQRATHDSRARTVTLVQRTPFSVGTQVLRRVDHQP